jgi:hypothetical protein
VHLYTYRKGELPLLMLTHVYSRTSLENMARGSQVVGRGDPPIAAMGRNQDLVVKTASYIVMVVIVVLA